MLGSLMTEILYTESRSKTNRYRIDAMNILDFLTSSPFTVKDFLRFCVCDSDSRRRVGEGSMGAEGGQS
jgi:hypothetical protein